MKLLFVPNKSNRLVNKQYKRGVLPSFVLWPQNFISNIWFFIQKHFGRGEKWWAKLPVFIAMLTVMIGDKDHLKREFFMIGLPIIGFAAFWSMFTAAPLIVDAPKRARIEGTKARMLALLVKPQRRTICRMSRADNKIFKYTVAIFVTIVIAIYEIIIFKWFGFPHV